MAAVILKKTPKLKQIFFNSKLITRPSSSAAAVSDSIAHIKSALLSERDPDRLAALFQSSVSSPEIHRDRAIYKMSIQKLARANRFDLIQRILDPQLSDPNLPRTQGFLICIISVYSDARMVDHAVRAFESIAAAGLKYTDRSLCALLSVFLKNRKYDRLVKSFNTVPKSIKISPSITAYNILLQGLCESGDVEAARKVLDEMPEKKINPDIVSYNVVFNGYLKKGDMVGCEEILKEMNDKGLKDDVITLNCRIACLCASGKSVEAEELLDVMGTKKVKPNRSTFYTIIEGFCKEGNAKKAMKVFERFKSLRKADEGSPSPTLAMYNALIKSLVENAQFGTALEVFNECLHRKYCPLFVAVRGLVEGLKKESRVEEAKDVVAKMTTVVKSDCMETWKSIEASFSL